MIGWRRACRTAAALWWCLPTGLGAPYWDMYARGTIVGLTRGSTKAHIARAVLECIAYQTADLVRVMNADAPCPLTELRVDGGASVSNILMQIQADLLRLPVDSPIRRKRVWRIWPAGIGRWSAPGVGLKTMCERCCVFEKREVY